MNKGVYKKNDPTYANNQKEFDQPKESFKAAIEILVTRFRNTPVSLLDIGCAAGAFLYHANKRLILNGSVGVDISPEGLQEARTRVPGVEFLMDSIETPKHLAGRMFDACTILGVLSIFDELEQVMGNVLKFTRPGGSVVIYDLINPDPVDVLMRFRLADSDEKASWNRAFNIRSRKTYEKLVQKLSPGSEVTFTPFRMPFPIPKTDPLRAWTVKTETDPHQIVVGTSQILPFHLLHILKPGP